jgi:type IV secretion system protein VirB8
MASELLQEYFQEAASWDRDRRAQAQRSTRRAWQVAAAGWLCAIASCGALAVLTPLKRVEPFVVRVDSSTGVVDVVPAYSGGAVLEQSVTRYFLSHYISVCERFNYSTAESDYEECGAFHSAQRNQAWAALWNPNNPNSPLNAHRDGSQIRAQVQSVSFFKRASGLSDLAQVRYLKSELQSAGSQARITRWIATIQYTYAAPSREPRLRRWNPLGFKVVDLSSEPEVPGDAQPVSPAAVRQISP